MIPFAQGNRWEYAAELDSDCFDFEDIFEVTAFDGMSAVLWNEFSVIRKYWNENIWDDMMIQMRNHYCEDSKEAVGEPHLRDVLYPMERVQILAKTPLQLAHTKAACAVMRRILDTDPVFHPGCTEIGHWNFFQYLELNAEDRKIKLNDNRTYFFEWKDISETQDARYEMLSNDIYGILMDAAGCIWSDEWIPGVTQTVKYRLHSLEMVTELCCEEAGSITTNAGTFDHCMRISMNIKEMRDGWSYRGVKKEYIFAQGIGIVRAISYYKDNTITAVYDLVSYNGIGEGYMPVCDGMVRHYDAVGLEDKFVAAAEYTYATDEKGSIVIRGNRTGVQILGK